MVKCNICKASGRNIEKCLTCNKLFHLVCANQYKGSNQCCLSTLQVKSKKSCHRCLAVLSDKKVACSNVMCNEHFCIKCIKYRYKHDLAEIPDYWECFVCLKTCSCKSCRKKATEKSKKVSDLATGELNTCHQCEKKVPTGRLTFCEKCKKYFCLPCSEHNYKNLDDCPFCLDMCTCNKCGDLRFNKDFSEFYKGADLRKMYPYDLQNIFCLNGFWIRSINL